VKNMAQWSASLFSSVGRLCDVIGRIWWAEQVERIVGKISFLRPANMSTNQPVISMLDTLQCPTLDGVSTVGSAFFFRICQHYF
jgi:hypothetical protein